MNLLHALSQLLGNKQPQAGPAAPVSRAIPLTYQSQPGELNRKLMFAGPSRWQPEDASLVNGPQGYGPANADIANFRGYQPQPNMLPQAEDNYTPSDALFRTGYINPQTTVNGYRQQDARARELQGDPYNSLRRLLGY